MQSKNSKLQFWSKLNKKWECSGLAQAKFCKQENINLKTFGKWRQIVKSNLTHNKISKSSQQDISHNKLKFLPVTISTTSERTDLYLSQLVAKIKINQLELQIFNGAEYETLKNLFLALKV